ncbi:MAG TPA: hypothetical protein VN706_15740 [Gemmatimonadaceae bacterium]|nr:hypothetical protein [Gemmatimonadaceae bacterium]
MLATASALEAARPALDRGWPGFGSTLAFGLVRPDTVAIVVSTFAPDGFRPLTCDAVPRTLHGRIFVRSGSWPGHGKAIQPVLDENRRIAGVSVGLLASPAATADLVAHEAFHLAYQFAHFQGAARSMERELPASVPIDSALTSSVAFELDGLARVLSHDDAASRKAGAATFLRLRNLRFQRMGAAAADAERQMEYMEGTAECVGLTAALAAGPKADANNLSAQLRDTLVALLHATARDVREHGATRELRPRSYYTGAALVTLLEDGEPSWRSDVEKGAFLDVILASRTQ